jgi:fructokinase
MILIIGEILIDELPDGHRPGGAPFNVAQHLTRLGNQALLLSRVGVDKRGESLRSALKKFGMSDLLVQSDPQHASGRVRVQLSGSGIPSYTILENVAYDHIDYQTLEIDWASCRLACFGSLIQRTAEGSRQLQDFLTALPPHVLRLYDMNLRPGCDHAELVFQSLEKTHVLKINDEELEHTGLLLGSTFQGDDLVRFIMERFNIQTVALTLGSAGSALFTAHKKYTVRATPLRAHEIADTVGAGDSFTAILAHGLLRGFAPDELLEYANRLAGHICTVHGAVPEDPSVYNDLK